MVGVIEAVGIGQRHRVCDKIVVFSGRTTRGHVRYEWIEENS